MPETTAAAAGGLLRQAVARELDRLLEAPLTPGLHLVATPIGHLGDISLRALAVLAKADIVCCEDTRHSLRLLERYGIRRSLSAYHEHNAARERPRLLQALAEAKSIALVSDAGTPLISDPGYKLVQEALAAGRAVTSVPGASAVLAALTMSGQPTDCFTFAGFLPSRAGQRLQRLRALAEAPGSLVLFEAPGRVADTLAAASEALGASRQAVLARELTKLHEELWHGTLRDLAERAGGEAPRGEVVIVVAPHVTNTKHIGNEEIAQALKHEQNGTLRDRVDAVAGRLGIPRKRVYALALVQQSHRESPAQRPPAEPTDMSSSSEPRAEEGAWGEEE